jgi:tagatose-1,6-bisphosphate aldolase
MGDIQTLTLVMCQVTSSKATEAVKAAASAILLDQNLEHVTLQMENGFKDEAGVALAKALTVNKTLRKITLSVDPFRFQVHNRVALGAPAYEAFSAMLRVNTSLVLELPPF